MTLQKVKRYVQLSNNSNTRMLEALNMDIEKRDSFWLSFLIRESWINLKRSISIWWTITNKLPGDNSKVSISDFFKEIAKIFTGDPLDKSR